MRGTETQPIRAVGTAVREQLCGRFDWTAARPICRDSCVVNPPEQPRPIRRESSANNLPGKRCGQSAGTAVRSIRRDSCAANPAGQLAADPSGQQCGGQRRGQSGPQGQRCGDSCAANPQGQQRGQSAAGTAAWPIRRDSCLANPPGQQCGNSGAVNPSGQRCGGSGRRLMAWQRQQL